MANVVVNYSEIINTISIEFLSITGYDIKFIITDEQQFIKNKDKDPDTLYVVVHFGDATTNFGQAVVPVTLEVLGLSNEIEQTKSFLNEFVTTFNRTQIGDTIQFYTTPTSTLNFNEVYDGFRSLLNVQGTIIIGNNTIRLETLCYWYDGVHYEEIDVISYNDSSENSLNPQTYPDGDGRTKSYGSFQTFAFSIVTYPDANKHLIQDIMSMKFGVGNLTVANRTFIFSATYTHSNINMHKWEFKCRAADFNQKIGEIPVITLGFSL